MRKIAREVGVATVVALVSGTLYRSWLICPILKHVTVNQWRAVAILVAVTIGSISALIQLRTSIFAPVFAVALLAGGTWAAMSAPHDVPVTLFEEFMSHLVALWREPLLITMVAVISNLLWAHDMIRAASEFPSSCGWRSC